MDCNANHYYYNDFLFYYDLKTQTKGKHFVSWVVIKYQGLLRINGRLYNENKIC